MEVEGRGELGITKSSSMRGRIPLAFTFFPYPTTMLDKTGEAKFSIASIICETLKKVVECVVLS